MRIRALSLACLACAAAASLATSCRNDLTAAAIESAPDAIAEEGAAGTSRWIVRPDGAVRATLRGPDGKPPAGPVTGQLTFAPPGAAPASVPVRYDGKTGVLSAAGPKLDADITPVTYTLSAGGAPWTGWIDVPRGGTKDLVETAGLQPPAPPLVGPNGGGVRTVGPDRIELVADRQTGDVRAYVLGADGQPVDPGDRRVTVAVEGDAPEVIALAPAPQARFLVGRLRARVDPAYVTVAVTARGTTHACLVGWSPGAVVRIGPSAPRLHLLAVDAWPGEPVEVRGPHGKHRGVFVAGAPGVVVEAPSLVVEPPSVVVGAPGVAVGAGVQVEDRDVDRGRRHGHGRGHGR